MVCMLRCTALEGLKSLVLYNTNRTYKKRVRFNKAKLCYDVLLLYHIRIKDISQTLIYNLDSIHFINI